MLEAARSPELIVFLHANNSVELQLMPAMLCCHETPQLGIVASVHTLADQMLHSQAVSKF